jgi:hypothetical protein
VAATREQTQKLVEAKDRQTAMQRKLGITALMMFNCKLALDGIDSEIGQCMCAMIDSCRDPAQDKLQIFRDGPKDERMICPWCKGKGRYVEGQDEGSQADG